MSCYSSCKRLPLTSTFVRYRSQRRLHAALAAGAGDGHAESSDNRPRSLKERWTKFWSVIPAESDSGALSFFHAIRTVWKLTRGHELWLFAGYAALTIGSLSELAAPHYVSKVYAAIITACANGPPLPPTSPFNLDTLNSILALSPALTHALTLYVLFAVLEVVFSSIRAACCSKVTIEVLRSLRQRVFCVFLHQEALWFGKPGNKSTELAARLSADCSAVSDLISLNLNIIFRNGLLLVGGLAYILWLNTRLASVPVTMVALLCFVSLHYGIFQRCAGREKQDKLATSSSMAEEPLSSIALVKAHGYEAAEAKRYGSHLAHIVAIYYRTLVAYTGFIFSTYSIWHAGAFGLLIMGTYYTHLGILTPAELMAFIMYNDIVAEASQSVCGQIGAVMENIGSVDKLLAILQLEKPPPDAAASAADALTPEAAIWQGGLAMDHVTFRYPGRRTSRAVLRDVCISVQPGESTALVGRSGSGKSTVAMHLARVFVPDSGAITLGGVDVAELDRDWFRRHIAIVPQDPGLFTASVFENISYGLPGATLESVTVAARAANAHRFISELPQGYEHVVSNTSLSGGQRQRLAIARALLRNPTLLILDEPTSALDAESDAAFQRTLDSVMADRSLMIVIVAHRLATIQSCEKIVVMDKGAVAEQGHHEELLEISGGIYANLVEQQSLVVSSVMTDDDSQDEESASDDEDEVLLVSERALTKQ